MKVLFFILTNKLKEYIYIYIYIYINNVYLLKDWGDHFRFGSVFTFKKQPNRKGKKKDPNRIGTGPNRPVSVRFGSGFWGPKTEKPMVIFLAS